MDSRRRPPAYFPSKRVSGVFSKLTFEVGCKTSRTDLVLFRISSLKCVVYLKSRN